MLFVLGESILCIVRCVLELVTFFWKVEKEKIFCIGSSVLVSGVMLGFSNYHHSLVACRSISVAIYIHAHMSIIKL